MEDLEASVGAHGGADLEERAGQLVGSSDEHEGDVAGASVDSLLVDGVEEGVLDVFVWDVVLAGAVCVVDGHTIIVVQNWGGVMLWCRQALIPPLSTTEYYGGLTVPGSRHSCGAGYR